MILDRFCQFYVVFLPLCIAFGPSTTATSCQLPSFFFSYDIYINIYSYLERSNQRRKNVKKRRYINKRKMSPKKGIYMSHNSKILWDIFLSFMRRCSRFCVVGCRPFSRYIQISTNLFSYQTSFLFSIVF